MKIAIKSWFTGTVLFEAEVDASLSYGKQLGAAIKMAVAAKADLSGADLRSAVLSGADLSGAVLRSADLSRAVLSGADLRSAVLSGADLSGAVLRSADLSRADLSRADLRSADLSRAVLSGADLRSAVLSGADLSGAVLRSADLSGAVLSGAVLPPIPVVPDIDKAVLAAIEAGGELEMGGWHVCETTHCRAGWHIHLAGKAGYDLEAAIGSAAAGALIYAASAPDLPVPDFYCSNEKAMADLRERAERISV